MIIITDIKSIKELNVFISITFIVTWIIWLIAFISSDWIISIGIFIPSITGLICAYLFGGMNEIKELIISLSYTNLSLKWTLYTFFIFPFIMFLSYILFMLTGGNLPEPQFPVWFIPIVFFYILILMGPLGEEFGWRGFALKRILLIYSPLKSGLILGIIWSAWHIPLFFIPGTIQHDLTKNGLIIVILAYFIYTTCISLLMTIAYINTDGSLLISILFHTVCNLTLGVAPLIFEKWGAIILLLSLVLITTTIAYKYICSWNRGLN